MSEKERPILFSGEMVRAILDGRKTVTRRVVKSKFGFFIPGQDPDSGEAMDGRVWPVDEGTDDWMVCPYGQPGDRLWVRESYFINKWIEELGVARILGHYMDGVQFDVHLTRQESEKFYRWEKKWGKKGSIYMFRSLSRITLEVTGVRVERVQEIDNLQSISEGVQLLRVTGERPAETFHRLWDSLNAARGFGWDKNPWVWVVEFRRLS